jgi:glutamine amidotransferase
MIAIVDYKIGNLFSVLNMCKYVGIDAKIVSQEEDILSADKLILPGVGHFSKGMENLRNSNLIESLNEAVIVRKKPILGICLGMQLMTNFSEEGDCEGLKWIDATTRKILIDSSLKVPHMGWNEVLFTKSSPLISEDFQNPRFYFVHSYHVVCNLKDDLLCTTQYGIELTAGFQHEHIFGVQFHPEKSHKYGMELLKKFNKI